MRLSIESKLCRIDEAVSSIKDNSTVASEGFSVFIHPESLTRAIEQTFLKTGRPKNLTLVHAAGHGEDENNSALNHFAHEGLIKCVIGSHWGWLPNLSKLIVNNVIEGYNFPQGVVCQLFRDIAAGRPGCITHIGLNTFVDPALEGGRCNSISKDLLVERINLGGQTWLLYKSFPLDVGLIRASAADPRGNLIMDREPMLGEVLSIAQAVHNCGGLVIAQVSRLLEEPANPKMVKVPGILVDKIVVSEPEEYEVFYKEKFNPAYISVRPGNEPIRPALQPLEMNERRVIAARACDEIPENAIVNLGIGIPEGIARIAAERGLLDHFTLTVESGLIGGMPVSGSGFGASVYPDAIIDQPLQFDFYDGGGLDFAALGAAQIDANGNVNVSRFNNRLAGVGGFINIAQTSKKVVFCGTFTAGGLQVKFENGKLHIVNEGKIRKFLKQVEQISFGADRARRIGQNVLYITERAVFKLVGAGIELIEVAPGIDIQKQVLDMMYFKPVIKDVRPMPEMLFKAAKD